MPTFRNTTASTGPALTDGVALASVRPLDSNLRDMAETGAMYSAEADGRTVHLFADEIA